MEVFVLLDRSGSMQVRWAETITMLNTYVNALAGEVATSTVKITLMLFDKAERTETPIIRDAVPAFRWTEIDPAEAAPRGYTPLLDAIGRLTALVEQRNPDKAVITILTDGEENASTEMTREGARAALERLKLVFLGADFNAFKQAGGVGVGATTTMQMASGSYNVAQHAIAARTKAFAATGKAFDPFTDEERKNAKPISAVAAH
jgi:uncharacterized protein YegL